MKQFLKYWTTQNRIISKDFNGLVTAVLEADPQIQWLTWCREEASNIEQQNRSMGINIVKDQFLGERQYSDIQEQIQFDETST